MDLTKFPIDPLTMDRRLPKALVYEMISERWIFKDGFPFAANIDEHGCPSCGHTLLMHKGFYFFKKVNKSRTNTRCDVTFKCQYCSYVFPKGVVVPPEEWREEREGNRYTHDVARDMIQGKGKGVTAEELLEFVANFANLPEEQQDKILEAFNYGNSR